MNDTSPKREPRRNRTDRVISRQGVQHKCREVVFGENSTYGVTLCHKHIELPAMGKSPKVKENCQTCYEMLG